jgi:divalent metal cation (Fe/Co/Zn/Cd) transporter
VTRLPEFVRAIALATRGVLACYDDRSRGRQGDASAELTIAVERSPDVEAANAIADEVERRVALEVCAREVAVHLEPYGDPESTDARASA